MKASSGMEPPTHVWRIPDVGLPTLVPPTRRRIVTVPGVFGTALATTDLSATGSPRLAWHQCQRAARSPAPNMRLPLKGGAFGPSGIVSARRASAGTETPTSVFRRLTASANAGRTMCAPLIRHQGLTRTTAPGVNGIASAMPDLHSTGTRKHVSPRPFRQSLPLLPHPP